MHAIGLRHGDSICYDKRKFFVPIIQNGVFNCGASIEWEIYIK